MRLLLMLRNPLPDKTINFEAQFGPLSMFKFKYFRWLTNKFLIGYTIMGAVFLERAEAGTPIIGVFSSPSVEWRTTFGGSRPSMEDNLLGRQPWVEDNFWWKTILNKRLFGLKTTFTEENLQMKMSSLKRSFESVLCQTSDKMTRR